MTEKQKIQGARLRGYRKMAGFDRATDAARTYGWGVSTYISHENGTRKMGDDDADKYAAKLSRPGRKVSGIDILYGPPTRAADPDTQGVSVIPVVGMIGAGSIVEPEFDQETHLFDVELPMPVPKGLVGFQVEGDSMLPRYYDGDVILVWPEQKRSLESFYGEEAAVRTADGRRYVKEIRYGRSKGAVTLFSFNSTPMEDVKLEWIGEIYLKVPKAQVLRVGKQALSSKAKKRQTTGVTTR